MSKPFSEYTYDDAIELIGAQPAPTGTVTIQSSTRRTPVAVAARKFYEGDHWQNTKGFIGQLPPASLPGASQITADIKAAFVSENVIQEVVETHISGVLGREPLWSFLKESTAKKEKDEQTGDILTPWWNEREALDDLQEAAETLALEGIAVKRIFFPRALIPENGQLSAPDIPQALEFIFTETLTSDVAGVFTDPDSQKDIGIYLFEEKNDQGDVVDNCAELSFLNEQGLTVCKVVKDKGEDQEFGPYNLGGRLLIFELDRRALITEQVQSNQRALNLAHTMMMRNVNMAGARERTVANAQPPKKPRKVQDYTNPGRTTETLEPGTYETGGGAVMFLMGYPVRNNEGHIVGYTNPNVTISDPAPVQVFRDTIAEQKLAIYSGCHQRHVLISGDATASGVSRKQAEKAFQRSLKETKTQLDAAGRWELETVLRLAAQIANQSATVVNLRADFNCLLDIGEPDPEEKKAAILVRDAGLISDETARGWIGIDDAEAEKKRIEEEAKTKQTTQLQQPLNARVPANQGTPAMRTLFGAQPNNLSQ